MRYFQFAYDAILLPNKDQFRGCLTIIADHFPSQKELKEFLCDGTTTSLAGHSNDIQISFPSIFEFESKEDFDSWRKE